MPHFTKFPEEIDSWRLTRESLRLISKDAMAEMRMWERFAAVRLGYWGDLDKIMQHEAESLAQKIYNEEMAKPPIQRVVINFLSGLLDTAQSFLTSKSNNSTKAEHQVELLFKYMHNHCVDGDVRTNITNYNCTDLLNTMLKAVIENRAALGLTTINPLVIAYNEKVNGVSTTADLSPSTVVQSQVETAAVQSDPPQEVLDLLASFKIKQDTGPSLTELAPPPSDEDEKLQATTGASLTLNNGA